MNRASSPTRRLLGVVWIEAKLRRKYQSTSNSLTFASSEQLGVDFMFDVYLRVSFFGSESFHAQWKRLSLVCSLVTCSIR